MPYIVWKYWVKLRSEEKCGEHHEASLNILEISLFQAVQWPIKERRGKLEKPYWLR